MDEKAITAELQAIEKEDVRTFLGSLNEELREITEWRMMGHTNEEIAQKKGCVRTTVERKFKLIREKCGGAAPERERDGGDRNESGKEVA